MAFPQLGNALPKRHHPILQRIARAAFRLSGWQIVGEPPNLAQFVAVGAPHVSMWDFFLGMMLIFGLGVRVSWMGKHTLFRRPIGGIMRWLGGLAINRSARHNVVDQAIALFANHPTLIIGLMPEGSRQRAGVPVNQWKTGFYYIAVGAGVPILPLRLDNPNKHVIFGPLLMPTGDKARDLDRLQAFYDDPAQDVPLAKEQ